MFYEHPLPTETSPKGKGVNRGEMLVRHRWIIHREMHDRHYDVHGGRWKTGPEGEPETLRGQIRTKTEVYSR